jgi:hypothetical protein
VTEGPFPLAGSTPIPHPLVVMSSTIRVDNGRARCGPTVDEDGRRRVGRHGEMALASTAAHRDTARGD